MVQIDRLAKHCFSATGRFKPSQYADNVISMLGEAGGRIYVEDVKASYERAVAGKINQPKWDSVLTAIKTDGGQPSGLCGGRPYRRALVVNNDFIIHNLGWS